MSMTKSDITETPCDLSKPRDRVVYWTEFGMNKLKHWTIVEVGYLSKKEMDELGWYGNPLCLQIQKGKQKKWIIPQCDDEGNDGGALTCGKDIFPTL